MPSLLVEVKAKMALYAHEKVRGLLDGEYGSVFKGRSMDFDDLREYTHGDDIKDIDWKATARSNSTLIRRYVAIRKHNIMLVVDTGRNMAAATTDGETKGDIAIMLAGVIGSIALKHDDLTGLVCGNAKNSKYIKLKSGRVNVERILQQIKKDTSFDAEKSNITTQLEYVARNIRRKMIIIVISDDMPVSERQLAATRRLRAQHEMLWVRIGDANPTENNGATLNIDDLSNIPTFLRTKKEVVKAFENTERQSLEQTTNSLNRLGITNHRIVQESDSVNAIFQLLERHRRVRRA